MNRRDEAAIVKAILDVVLVHPDAPVIMLDATKLFSNVRNARRTGKFVEDVNDILSLITVCSELGGVYAVCEYESYLLMLIKASAGISLTERYDPAISNVTRIPGAYFTNV